jgi:8-oxo-dGTP pyrophosphatase MutT (NUDIX family)
MIKVVGIILYNKETKILFQERGDEAPTYPSKWGMFGGAIEKGETPLEAIKRECMEELDYELNEPPLIYQGKYCMGYAYIFAQKFDNTKKLILGEGKSMKWFSLEELKNVETVPFDFKILFDKIKTLI